MIQHQATRSSRPRGTVCRAAVPEVAQQALDAQPRMLARDALVRARLSVRVSVSVRARVRVRFRVRARVRVILCAVTGG